MDVNFEFNAQASQMLAETRKLLDQQKAMEKALQSAAKAAEQGAAIATQAYRSQNASTQALITKNEALKKKIEEIKQAHQESGKIGTAAMSGIAQSITSNVLGAIREAIQLQQQFQKELASSARMQDAVGRKLQVQTLTGDKEFQSKIKPKVFEAAQAAGVPMEKAQEVATELVSQGFTTEQATGPVLKEILLGAVATGTDDIKTVATGIAGMLKSSGKELTPENVRATSQSMTALFNPTSVNAMDTQSLAKIGAMMKEFGISQQTALASFAVLKDTGGEESGQAATHLRNMVGVLSTIKSKPESMDTIRQIGGDELVDSIDLSGESLPQALTTLKAHLDTLAPESRNAAVGRIFGQEMIAPAYTLMGNLPKIQEYEQLQQDDSYLKKGVQVATQGENVASIRQENQREMDTHKQAQTAARNERWIDAMKTELMKRNVSAYRMQAIESQVRNRIAMGGDVEGGMGIGASVLGNIFAVRGAGVLEDVSDVPNIVNAKMRAAEKPSELPSDIVAPAAPKVERPSVPKLAGKDRHINLSDKFVSDEDKNIDALKQERDAARIELDKAELGLKGDGKLSKTEKKKLVPLRNRVADLGIKVDEAELAKDKRMSAGLPADKPAVPVASVPDKPAVPVASVPTDKPAIAPLSKPVEPALPVARGAEPALPVALPAITPDVRMFPTAPESVSVEKDIARVPDAVPPELKDYPDLHEYFGIPSVSPIPMNAEPERKAPEESFAELYVKAYEAGVKLAQARETAKQPTSEGGSAMTDAEKRTIALLEQLVQSSTYRRDEKQRYDLLNRNTHN